MILLWNNCHRDMIQWWVSVVLCCQVDRNNVGIARALYKNPQILFMDEATSALDIETEQAVNEAIQKLNGQKL
jgi:ABC-type transport system involved in Fe-S cluster assembly fused permease/ATPase subunit